MVGQRTLDPYVGVQILPSQPFLSILIFLLTELIPSCFLILGGPMSYMKKILLSLILCFLLFPLIADNKVYVGKISKTWITEEEYVSLVRTKYENFVTQYTFDPNPQQKQQLAEEAWQDLISTTILNEAIKDRKIYVTNQEVLDSLQQNIPNIVKKSKRFQNESGEFLLNDYLSSLQTGKPENLTMIKQYYYNSYIPVKKLEKKLLQELVIPPAQVKERKQLENSYCSASLFYMPYNHFKEEPTQDELHDYYNKNKNQFIVLPSCDISYAIIPVRPDSLDSLSAKTTIDSLYHSLERGEALGVLINKFSDTAVTHKNGDLGFYTMSELPEEIQQQIRDIPINGYSNPLWYNGCWRILSPTDKTNTMVRLRELAISPKITEKSRKKFSDNVVHFRELALSIGLKQAAIEYTYPLYIKKNCTINDTYLEKLGDSENVIRRSLHSQEKTLFEPIYHKGLQSYVLISVDNIQSQNIKSFDTVIDTIVTIVEKAKQKATAEQYGKKCYKELKTENDFLNAGFEKILVDSLRLHTPIANENLQSLNSYLLLSNKQGSITPAVLGQDAIYMGMCNSKPQSVPTWQGYDDEKIINMMKAEISTNYVETWLAAQIQKVKIKDMRKK